MTESRRLALTAAVSVAAAVAVACVCFNLLQDAQLRSESQQAIDEAVSWTEDPTAVPASRTANYLYLTEGYEVADDAEWSSQLDLAIAEWCAGLGRRHGHRPRRGGRDSATPRLAGVCRGRKRRLPHRNRHPVTRGE